MKLKHIVLAAAAAVALPAFAQESSDAIFMFKDLPSTRTRAEVRAEALGVKNYGEAGSPFLFDAVMLRNHPMLTREEVRQMLISQGAIYVMPGA
jgi:hypothetical protein